MCLIALFACMYVHHVYMPDACVIRDVCSTPELELEVSESPHVGPGNLNMCPLKEQQVLLPALSCL